MKTYIVRYCREQHVDYAVEANSLESALQEVHESLDELDLFSPDDISDDPGKVFLLEILEEDTPSTTIPETNIQL